MDSPLSQSQATPLQRMRTLSNLSVLDHRGGIQKRSSTSSAAVRSISTSQIDRLYQLAIEQSNDQIDLAAVPSTAADSCWLTPQSSPQPHVYSDSITDPFPHWDLPTPPRSDSGVALVSLDANEIAVTTGITTGCDFVFDQQPTAAAEMSSLGFLLPSQYGSGHIESEPLSYNMDQNYIPPPRMSQPSGVPAQTGTSSPSLYQSRSTSSVYPNAARHPDLHHQHSDYSHAYRRVSNSYDSVSSGDYTMAPSQTIPSISGLTHSPQPSPQVGTTSGSMMSPFHPTTTRSPGLYDSGMYGQQYNASLPPSMPSYSQSSSYSQPFVGSNNTHDAKSLSSDASIRVINQRPKPQCWEHGCNGRQFSTFSNLLRHQREKSGTASKSYCPKCGAEFTRTTARNGHLAHDKCTKTQGRRQSEDDD